MQPKIFTESITPALLDNQKNMMLNVCGRTRNKYKKKFFFFFYPVDADTNSLSLLVLILG